MKGKMRESVCPNCEQIRMVRLIDEKRALLVRGQRCIVDVHLLKCSFCHEEFDDFKSPCDELGQAYRQIKIRKESQMKKKKPKGKGCK